MHLVGLFLSSFLVIFGVAISGELFSSAKAKAYYVMKLYNHLTGMFQFKYTFIHKFHCSLNLKVKTLYRFTP